jgi:hypothetical protein
MPESIVRIASKALVSSYPAVEIMRFIPGPRIEARRVTHCKFAMSDKSDDRASTARTTIGGRLPRHVCPPNRINRIIGSLQRSRDDKPAQGDDKKSYPRHRLNPQLMPPDLRLFGINEQYVERGGIVFDS